MAKKNTSVNLEEDILDYIDDYRTINTLSSRNKALERIILKFQTQEKEINTLQREIESLKFFENIVKNKKINITSDNNTNDIIEKVPPIDNTPKELSGKGRKFKSALEEIGE